VSIRRIVHELDAIHFPGEVAVRCGQNLHRYEPSAVGLCIAHLEQASLGLNGGRTKRQNKRITISDVRENFVPPFLATHQYLIDPDREMESVEILAKERNEVCVIAGVADEDLSHSQIPFWSVARMLVRQNDPRITPKRVAEPTQIPQRVNAGGDRFLNTHIGNYAYRLAAHLPPLKGTEPVRYCFFDIRAQIGQRPIASAHRMSPRLAELEHQRRPSRCPLGRWVDTKFGRTDSTSGAVGNQPSIPKKFPQLAIGPVTKYTRRSLRDPQLVRQLPALTYSAQLQVDEPPPSSLELVDSPS